tara:strand:+ start:2748 stop:3044 length:297 start_codon:yes stop_codon:yes gene_type:complete
MATKTWKIGEYAKGGIITAVTKGDELTIIGKDWDFSAGCGKGSNQSNAKEWCRETFKANQRREADNYLNDLTTSYYSDQIMGWAKKNGVEFKGGFDNW